MHKFFIKSLTWNTSSAFFYKMSLLAHQILLYTAIPHTLYGVQSSLFACIYTLIAFTNFGFDETLLPYFPLFFKNKQQFHKLCMHVYIHISILCCIAGIAYTILAYAPGEFLHNIQLYCNKNIILLSTLIFLTEAIKKTIYTILQLAGMHKQAAYAQIGMIITYITMVWGWHAFQTNMTLYSIFVPMLISSYAELCYVSFNAAQFYTTLPQADTIPTLPFKDFFKQRCLNYIHQISKALYSPNMLILWFVYYIGLPQAATIKLYTNIITLAYANISKIIGVSTGTTISTLHHVTKHDLYAFFYKVTYRYFQMLVILSILIMIVLGFAWYQTHITTFMAYNILLFFLINLVENWSLTYEQLFIAQGYAWYIALCTTINMIITGTALYMHIYHQTSQSSLMITYIISKIIIFCALQIKLLCIKN